MNIIQQNKIKQDKSKKEVKCNLNLLIATIQGNENGLSQMHVT